MSVVNLRGIGRFFPFLDWAPELRSPRILRADLIAGITVALVLIPQSMAYAQLAGLPPYYGLYAAFLPPAVAALFGSSRQLATGPVAVVSLLTAAALEPIAAADPAGYIAYAVTLALLVGLFQFFLGAVRLGVLVNFLSHPVVLGFSNAAAIIIATSQLSKLFGVTVEKAPHHYQTVWNTVRAAVGDTHLPTLGMAIAAIVIMVSLRRLAPRLPNVLIAVAFTTLLSWGSGFHQERKTSVERIADRAVVTLIGERMAAQKKIVTLQQRLEEAQKQWVETRSRLGPDDAQTLEALHRLDALRLTLREKEAETQADLKELRGLHFLLKLGDGGEEKSFHLAHQFPTGERSDGRRWRIRDISPEGEVRFEAGGAIVGVVPAGLPAFSLPKVDMSIVTQLFLSAVAISLIGFMEAISIAKAMATRTRQHLDANRELMGQGLANMVGSLFQSYPTSGSFSRSAVNIDAGAVTGFSSVITTLVVVVTLLWLTPLLYHLPQATLAAVIMMAVIGLVNVAAFRHLWRVHRQDATVALVTFGATLIFAPHLDTAIMIGVLLSLGLYLYRTMKPRIVVLSRHPDGSLRDAYLYGLATCPNITVLRLDGSLYFANASHFHDKVLEKLARYPDLRFVIVDAEGINQIDATGEEILERVVEQLEQSEVEVLFARMKKQVTEVLEHSGFVDKVGRGRFFRRTEHALEYAWKKLGNHHEVDCPLMVPTTAERDAREQVSAS